MRFFVDLFRGRPGTYKPVKSGARTARDSDKQEWEQHSGQPAHVERFERRLLDRIPAKEDPNHTDRDRAVKHEPAEISARLQQSPHRHQRRYDAVYEDDNSPCLMTETQQMRIFGADIGERESCWYEDDRRDPERR